MMRGRTRLVRHKLIGIAILLPRSHLGVWNSSALDDESIELG